MIINSSGSVERCCNDRVGDAAATWVCCGAGVVIAGTVATPLRCFLAFLCPPVEIHSGRTTTNYYVSICCARDSSWS